MKAAKFCHHYCNLKSKFPPRPLLKQYSDVTTPFVVDRKYKFDLPRVNLINDLYVILYWRLGDAYERKPANNGSVVTGWYFKKTVIWRASLTGEIV